MGVCTHTHKDYAWSRKILPITTCHFWKVTSLDFPNLLFVNCGINMTYFNAFKAHNSFSIWIQDLRIINIILEQLERNFLNLMPQTRKPPFWYLVFFFPVFFYFLLCSSMISFDPMLYIQLQWFIVVPYLQWIK